MSTKLTRDDLSKAITDRLPTFASHAREAVDVILETLTQSLIAGKEVELRGFGSFDIKMAKPRPGRNPNKPEQVVMIPARRIIKFKPGKTIRDAIRPEITPFVPAATPPPAV